MNTLQQTLSKILPRSWFAAIEAESRVWMVCCGCGLARSLWTAGGMRGKGAGIALAHAMPPLRLALLAQDLSHVPN